MNSSFVSQEQIALENQRFMVKVYTWMTLALALTGAVAYYTAGSERLLRVIFSSKFTFYGLIIAELVLVVVLSAAINKMSAFMATFVFLFYSAVNGLTLSAIFLLYTSGSIASTFLVTAGTFAVMSAYGYFTKKDLTRWGSLLFMALIGLIIASVVNWFLNSETLYWISTYAGVLIFTGLTAYDTQKIKKQNKIGNEGTEEDRKEAILGALTLYLDFINLFLYLLRIMGKRR